MSLPGFPHASAVVGATGEADTDPIAVPGIKQGDVLLAVIGWEDEGAPVGHDVSDFTVDDDEITAATIDTTDQHLLVYYYPAPVSQE